MDGTISGFNRWAKRSSPNSRTGDGSSGDISSTRKWTIPQKVGYLGDAWTAHQKIGQRM